MPIVQTNSNLYRNALLDQEVQDPLIERGTLRRATGTVANLSTDLSGSTYRLVSLPSYVILAPGTLFHVENWGFAAVRIGTLADNDALLSVATSAATSQSPVTGIAAAAAPRLWETLGLASDPGGFITLYAHAIADAAGAGSMNFAIEYFDNV